MKTSPQKIDRLIREIKKRLKLRSIQQGVSIFLLSFITLAFIYFIVMSVFGKSSLVFSLVITIAAVVLLLEMIWFVLRPGFSKISDQQIALFIEEKFPELEDRINSAVEIKDHTISGIEQSKIIDKLIDDATNKIKSVQFKGITERKKEKTLAYFAYGLFFLFSLMTFSYIDDLRRLTSDVEFSLNPKTHFSQEIINIIPGNIQIEKGESVDIIAELKASTDEDLILHYKMADDVWIKETMETSIDKQKSIFRIISVQEPTTYYVEHNEILSQEFNISIYEFPKVTQINLKYKYPAYTGLPDRIEENTGNIRGLQGSDVTLTIQYSGSPTKGELVLDESTKIKLAALENGNFQGKIKLSETGVYHVNLTDDQGKTNKFPIQYQITPVEDMQSIITINDPQRDVRVNAVEEVLIDVSVSDDFGVNSTSIKYSVNGEDEESISLFEKERSREKEINGSHLFYLEDYSLEPGDVISYYVDAEDNFHQASTQSDMYFIEVVPFDAKFTQLNNQGGGGGGGQQSSQMVVNQQTIISATWNLLRKLNEISENEFEESADAIEQSQLNLRDNINERINTTAFSVEMAVDDENKEIADLLRKAVEQMGEAVEELSKRDMKSALTPERKALNFLLKADAKNKEKLIQRGQMAGGGGSGGNSEDRMTELMDLELDISKDKYEIQQQSEQQKNAEVDDTLQKLRELAKKQQLLAQQSKENLQEQDNRRELDRLKRDQEQLRHDSENLANQMQQMARDNDRISQQMQQRIDDITQNLRKAEQELKSNNVQQAMARQNQALNELNKLQDELRMSLTDDVREMLNEFTDNFNDFKEKERQLSEDIREEFTQNQINDGNITDKEGLQNLTQKRKNMLDQLESIESQARTIEENARQENPKIATELKNIQNAIQREDIKRNMEGSKELLKKGWLTYADMIEEEIKLGIDAVDEKVRQLQAGGQVSEEEMLNRSLEDTRELMWRFQESMAQVQGEQQANENRQDQEGSQQQQGNRGGRPNRNDAARMGRLMEQANEMLQRMERNFQNNQNLRQQLNNTQRLFGQDNVGTLLGENAEEYFKNKVYDPLSQLETQLLKRLDEIELQKKLYSLRKEEVPSEYKRLVDKYFESISK